MRSITEKFLAIKKEEDMGFREKKNQQRRETEFPGEQGYPRMTAVYHTQGHMSIMEQCDPRDILKAVIPRSLLPFILFFKEDNAQVSWS